MQIKCVTILVLLGSAIADGSISSKIATDVQSDLDHDQRANVIISFVGGITAALSSVKSARFSSRQQRLNVIHRSLSQNAETSQKGVLRLLSFLKDVEFRRFWINNQIFVRDANSSIVTAIAQDPQVLSIDKEVVIYLNESLKVKNAPGEGNNQWGIDKIKATEAWQEMGWQNGNGVIVATIDTGVRGTHEALKDNFLGDYGWYDPIYSNLFPTDVNGHGTHVTGTIVGGKGIGVAPGAKWASCRGCDVASCNGSYLIACGEFFTCPTLPDGSNKDCSRAPHVVSNSWGGGTGTSFFADIIRVWHVAGIIPVFAVGNSGPNCTTTNSPGNYQNVIAVGSTNSHDTISNFSSRGPTPDGRLKPEVVAPGADITSASHTSDTSYATFSGTSMACPHVAGVIALLLTRNKQLTYQQAKDLLVGNTDQDLQFGGGVCGDIADNTFPNNFFGYGRINALKSVQAQTSTLTNLSHTIRFSKYSIILACLPFLNKFINKNYKCPTNFA